MFKENLGKSPHSHPGYGTLYGRQKQDTAATNLNTTLIHLRNKQKLSRLVNKTRLAIAQYAGCFYNDWQLGLFAAGRHHNIMIVFFFNVNHRAVRDH
jgi:hypothetical protein